MAKSTLVEVKKVLRRYKMSHGLSASVWIDLREIDEILELEGSQCHYPLPSEEDLLVHWDEGFCSFLDGSEEYDLHSN